MEPMTAAQERFRMMIIWTSSCFLARIIFTMAAVGCRFPYTAALSRALPSSRKNAARVRCQYERAVTAVQILKKPKERFQTAESSAVRSGRCSFVSFMR